MGDLKSSVHYSGSKSPPSERQEERIIPETITRGNGTFKVDDELEKIIPAAKERSLLESISRQYKRISKKTPNEWSQIIKKRGLKEFDVDRVIKKYKEANEEKREIDDQKSKLKKLEGEEAKNKKRTIREKEKILFEKLRKLEEEFFSIPNEIATDVPVGKDESENKVVKKWGKIPKFSFKPKDHLELAERLDLIDVKRASKVSGARFGYFKNEAVLLEFALIQFAFETLLKEGFIPVIPPVLIKKEITDDLGYWELGGNEDYYWVHEPEERQGLYLVGTAEHSIVPMYKDEILNSSELPKRHVAFSTCFRREAGSYGKDARGILRVHQFDKVEMVSFTKQEESNKEHEYLLSLEEKLFKTLEIPYEVVKMCTGDLGHPAARKYDIEAWMPGQGRYREVTSTSTTTDYQARRLNIKYEPKTSTKKLPKNSRVEITEPVSPPTKIYVHIINGTAFAIGRTIIAILENYQQKDGSVKIPKILQKYVGKEKISSR